MSSSPRDVADLLQRDLGEEEAIDELQDRFLDAGSDGEQKRALAVLAQLRKMQADSEPVEAAICGKLGCRSGDQLAKLDGRVLCPDCRAEYALNER